MILECCGCSLLGEAVSLFDEVSTVFVVGVVGVVTVVDLSSDDSSNMRVGGALLSSLLPVLSARTVVVVVVTVAFVFVDAVDEHVDEVESLMRSC